MPCHLRAFAFVHEKWVCESDKRRGSFYSKFESMSNGTDVVIVVTILAHRYIAVEVHRTHTPHGTLSTTSIYPIIIMEMLCSTVRVQAHTLHVNRISLKANACVGSCAKATAIDGCKSLLLKWPAIDEPRRCFRIRSRCSYAAQEIANR